MANSASHISGVGKMSSGWAAACVRAVGGGLSGLATLIRHESTLEAR